jgi:WD40 repeat protein
MVSGGQDNTVKLWDVETGKIKRTLGHTRSVLSIALSPDGRTLASTGSHDKTVQLWDTETGALISTLTGHGDLLDSLAFSRDGKTIASGDRDGIVKL